MYINIQRLKRFVNKHVSLKHSTVSTLNDMSFNTEVLHL